jgi:hypothetical protein
MAMMTIEGKYKNGRVELSELPAGIDEAPVMVVFLPKSVSIPMDEEERERRRQAAFRQMEEGIDLGGPAYPKREELYDRFDRPKSAG